MQRPFADRALMQAKWEEEARSLDTGLGNNTRVIRGPPAASNWMDELDDLPPLAPPSAPKRDYSHRNPVLRKNEAPLHAAPIRRARAPAPAPRLFAHLVHKPTPVPAPRLSAEEMDMDLDDDYPTNMELGGEETDPDATESESEGEEGPPPPPSYPRPPPTARQTLAAEQFRARELGQRGALSLRPATPPPRPRPTIKQAIEAERHRGRQLAQVRPSPARDVMKQLYHFPPLAARDDPKPQYTEYSREPFDEPTDSESSESDGDVSDPDDREYVSLSRKKPQTKEEARAIRARQKELDAKFDLRLLEEKKRAAARAAQKEASRPAPATLNKYGLYERELRALQKKK